MCLYSKLIRNPKYKPNKKNGGNVPQPSNLRLLYVPVGCGHCIECRKQKARAWQVRLHEEYKTQKYAYFVTLSFSPEALKELKTKSNETIANNVAKYAVRLFLERYRKKYKISLRHWLITELGHQNTERIHLHGIIFPKQEMTNEELQNLWKYGNTYTGDYCNEQTINYVIKYVTKIDIEHKGFEGKILCSAGIGNNYTNTFNAGTKKYKPNKTREYYDLPNGTKINLPIYYRNKLYTEKERELLWLEKMDKHELFVRGIKVSVRTERDIKNYLSLLKEQQRQNAEMGFGDDSKEWNKRQYYITMKMMNLRPISNYVSPATHIQATQF